jgi:hypothetical protein
MVPRRRRSSADRRPRPSRAAALLMLACGAVGLLAGCVMGGAGAAASGPTPLLVSLTGADANPCTQAAPCLTFDRAYHVAKPGQPVEVAAAFGAAAGLALAFSFWAARGLKAAEAAGS